VSLYFRLFYSKKKKAAKFNKLENSPQAKAVTTKTRVTTPKKPNSAKRAVAKVLLMNNNSLIAYIPGVGHNLRKHSLVLIRGGRERDLPGVYYKCVRGVYDLSSVLNRFTRRSLYGVKKPEALRLKIRRKFRQS